MLTHENFLSGEKVKITDYEPKRPLKTLLPGEPLCAPLGATLAEQHISLLRKLHATDGWTKHVNDNLAERLQNAREILYDNSSEDKTPTPSETDEEYEPDEGMGPVSPTRHHHRLDSTSRGNQSNSIEKVNLNNFDDVDKLCKEAFPVLAVIGGVDRGLRVGAECLHKPTGKKGIVLGTLKVGLSSVKVQWDDQDSSITDCPVTALEPCPALPFDAQKFTILNADMLRLITTLTGITGEIKFPMEAATGISADSTMSSSTTSTKSGGSSGVGGGVDEEDLNKDQEEMTTSLKGIGMECSQQSIWDGNANAKGSGGKGEKTPGSGGVEEKMGSAASSSTALVEALSSQMVSDIIHEVTRKGSAESVGSSTSVGGQTGTANMIMSSGSNSNVGGGNTSVDDGRSSELDKKKEELELESACVKMTYLQFGAMKSLQCILSCSYFSEFLLIPKRKKPKDGKSLQEGVSSQDKDGKEEEKKEGTSVSEDVKMKQCPKCGHHSEATSDGHGGSDDPICPFCGEDRQNLQNALKEAFRHLVDSCVKPCKLPRLYQTGEVERLHSILHHLHVRQLVDFSGPKFSSHLGGGGLHNKEYSGPGNNGWLPCSVSGSGGRRKPQPSDTEQQGVGGSSGRSGQVPPRNRTFLPMTLANIASRLYPPLRFGPRSGGSGSASAGPTSIPDDHLGPGPTAWSSLDNGGGRETSNRVRSSMSGLGVPGGGSSSNCHRRRQRRSPSPPATGRSSSGGSAFPSLNGRLPTALLEMGFTPRHIRSAMAALGLTGELSVAAVSQLASWMLENPSIDSAEHADIQAGQGLGTSSGGVQDRYARPWTLGSTAAFMQRVEQIGREEMGTLQQQQQQQHHHQCRGGSSGPASSSSAESLHHHQQFLPNLSERLQILEDFMQSRRTSAAAATVAGLTEGRHGQGSGTGHRERHHAGTGGGGGTSGHHHDIRFGRGHSVDEEDRRLTRVNLAASIGLGSRATRAGTDALMRLTGVSVPPQDTPGSALVRIPIVILPPHVGDRGLCCFCFNIERDIVHHFLVRHQGCGLQFPNGYCGEVREEQCYML